MIRDPNKHNEKLTALVNEVSNLIVDSYGGEDSNDSPEDTESIKVDYCRDNTENSEYFDEND